MESNTLAIDFEIRNANDLLLRWKKYFALSHFLSLFPFHFICDWLSFNYCWLFSVGKAMD